MTCLFVYLKQLFNLQYAGLHGTTALVVDDRNYCFVNPVLKVILGERPYLY